MPHIEYKDANGEVWPSATQLTYLLPKDWLWAWYKREVQRSGWDGWLKCNATSEIGKKTGTLTHYFLECLVKQQAPELEDKFGATEYAKKLFEVTSPLIEEYVAIEPHLKHDKLKIHGSADIIVRRPYDSGLWIGDYKTSYKIDVSHPIQLAIYALCWNYEHPDMKVDKGFIARIDKGSKGLNVKIDEYVNLKQYRPLIVSLRRLWQYLHD